MPPALAICARSVVWGALLGFPVSRSVNDGRVALEFDFFWFWSCCFRGCWSPPPPPNSPLSDFLIPVVQPDFSSAFGCAGDKLRTVGCGNRD